MFAVGMICCDGDGHLNDKSTMLQSRYSYILFIFMLSKCSAFLLPPMFLFFEVNNTNKIFLVVMLSTEL